LLHRLHESHESDSESRPQQRQQISQPNHIIVLRKSHGNRKWGKTLWVNAWELHFRASEKREKKGRRKGEGEEREGGSKKIRKGQNLDVFPCTPSQLFSLPNHFVWSSNFLQSSPSRSQTLPTPREGPSGRRIEASSSGDSA